MLYTISYRYCAVDVRAFFSYSISRACTAIESNFPLMFGAVGCTVALMVGGRRPDLRSSPCPSRLLRAFTATTTTLRPRPSVGPSVTFWVVVSTRNFFFKRVFFFPLIFFPVVNRRRWSFTHFCWSVALSRFAFPGQTGVRDQPYGGSKSRLGGRTNTHGRTCSCTTSLSPSHRHVLGEFPLMTYYFVKV